jgi:hypothetical protein
MNPIGVPVYLRSEPYLYAKNIWIHIISEQRNIKYAYNMNPFWFISLIFIPYSWSLIDQSPISWPSYTEHLSFSYVTERTVMMSRLIYNKYKFNFDSFLSRKERIMHLEHCYLQHTSGERRWLIIWFVHRKCIYQKQYLIYQQQNFFSLWIRLIYSMSLYILNLNYCYSTWYYLLMRGTPPWVFCAYHLYLKFSRVERSFEKSNCRVVVDVQIE